MVEAGVEIVVFQIVVADARGDALDPLGGVLSRVIGPGVVIGELEDFAEIAQQQDRLDDRFQIILQLWIGEPVGDRQRLADASGTRQYDGSSGMGLVTVLVGKFRP